jgi:hypothetical protein
MRALGRAIKRGIILVLAIGVLAIAVWYNRFDPTLLAFVAILGVVVLLWKF